jgi:hypothetical protein
MTAGAQTLTLHHSLHSVLKEFFDPLRANDSRTDFFAVYRRESRGFDRDYAKKYDEDLNTSAPLKPPDASEEPDPSTIASMPTTRL